MLVLVTINVDRNTFTNTLRMCHLTEYTSIRAGDSFDCCIRTIWIEVFIHCWLARQINISGSNLTICKQFIDNMLRCHETTLAMRCRDRIYST